MTTESSDEIINTVLTSISTKLKEKVATVIETADDEMNYCYTVGNSCLGGTDFISAVHIPYSQVQFLNTLMALLKSKVDNVQFVSAHDLKLHGDYQLKIVPLDPNDERIARYAHLSDRISDALDVPWSIAQLVWPDKQGNYPGSPEYASGLLQRQFAPLKLPN